MLQEYFTPFALRSLLLGHRADDNANRDAYQTCRPATIRSAAKVNGERTVFTIVVEAGFSATHRVRYADGTAEEPHGHTWRVRAFFSKEHLDGMGMVIDFGEAQTALRSAVNELENTDLNAHPALRGANPTAEVVAKYLFDRVLAAGISTLRRVEVTEAPGCVAIFEREMTWVRSL